MSGGEQHSGKRKGRWLESAKNVTWRAPHDRTTSHKLPIGPVQTRMAEYPGGATLVGLHKGVVDVISRAPFPAVPLMQGLVRACHDAPTKKERLKAVSALAGTVAGLTALHVRGAVVNAADAMKYGELFAGHPTLLTGLAALVHGTVSLGYAGATYAQTSVGGATLLRTSREWGEMRDPDAPPKDRPAIGIEGPALGCVALLEQSAWTPDLDAAADHSVGL